MTTITSYLLLLITFLPIVVQCYALNLPIKGPCKGLRSSCTGTNDCCSGTKCHSSEQRCCRSTGPAATPSECCNPRLWKANSTSSSGQCACVEHALPCEHLSDCCSALKCDYAPSDSSKKICI